MNGKKNKPRRLGVLDAIRQFMSKHGYSPSMRDLMEMTGISSLSAVKYYLDQLEGDGLIRRSRNIARSIEIGNFNPKPTSARKFRLIITSDAKKAAAGRKGKGNTAFVPRKTKRTDSLQKRIDMVVEMAQKRGEAVGAGYDVIKHDPHQLRLRGAHKIG